MKKNENNNTENDQPSEKLDFSGLFKIDVLVNLDILKYSFYEVGLKKCIALASANELIFIYIHSEDERITKKYPWNFDESPIDCMCFEPTGTWLVIANQTNVILVPFLPLFISQNTFDLKWSLREITKLDLTIICNPTSLVWWLTKESENVLVIGLYKGPIIFYSMDFQAIVAESKIASDIVELQICFDDSLDLLALIISGANKIFWKLILEHRSLNYNWLTQCRAQQVDKDKKEGFMSYIKQLSKDKITLFTQSTSKEKEHTTEYMINPTEYLPHMFQRSPNSCSLTAQYVNGHHFLTAFSASTGTLILKSVKSDNFLNYKPNLNTEDQYIQGLWTKRIIYLLQKNKVDLHSSAFSVVEEASQNVPTGTLMWSTNLEGDVLKACLMSVREPTITNAGWEASQNVPTGTLMWSTNLEGDVLKACLMSVREPTITNAGWVEPTFLSDLQLPRFNLHPCLVFTTRGVFLLSTVCSACEWIVGIITRGGAGAERAAAALGTPMGPALVAGADLLLARGKLSPAEYLYSLSQYPQDGWLARLGVFGRIKELSNVKQSQINNVASSSLILKFLADLLKRCTHPDEALNLGNKLSNLKTTELKELSCIAANLGLWALLPIFNIHRGQPSLFMAAIKTRSSICRGTLNAMIKQKNLVPLLEDDTQFFFEFISSKCSEFDLKLLKRLCIWLCPLQEEYRPVLRDLRQGIVTSYTKKMQLLIDAFIRVCSSIDYRNPSTNISTGGIPETDIKQNYFVPKRTISCGINHWAIADGGQAKVFLTDVPINTEFIGRVIDIACGRHHTLVLTENGVYSSGDNTYGQLGVRVAWPGGADRDSSRGGALVRVPLEARGVAAGNYHSAALTHQGELYTWGWGVHGQLGLGDIEDQYSPQLVTAFNGQKVQKVSLGTSHTLALSSGVVWAAGAGWGGQLGLPRHKQCVPRPVPLDDIVLDIAAGHYHNLALTVKGEIWCWGASPQCIRAAAARVVDPSTSVPISLDPSLNIPPPPPSQHLQTPGAPDPPQTSVSPDLLQTSVAPDPLQTSGAPDPCSPSDVALQSPTYAPDICVSPEEAPVKAAPIQTVNYEAHLVPSLVDTRNVVGEIVQIAAGCHHSAIVTSRGAVYTWGLNFDGQLGSGKRKQIQIPTEATITTDMQMDTVSSPAATSAGGSMARIACGGDFTVFLDEQGTLFITGNTHDQSQNEPEKNKRVIVMKRVIKIPSNRSKNKLVFQYIDKINKLIDEAKVKRQPIDSRPNPLIKLSDFNKQIWADKVIILLKPWIKEEAVSSNFNMAAKLAFHTKRYSDCLKYLLNSINMSPPNEKTYLTHSDYKPETRNAIREVIEKTVSKRIKEIGLAILNEQSYPEIQDYVFKSLFCCCEEKKYLTNTETDLSIGNPKKQNATEIMDKCMSIFPSKSELWTSCFGICKDYFVQNNLPVKDLEVILQKYMHRDITGTASAVLFSKDSQEYGQILSPSFYLNLCNEVLNSWS